MDRAIMPDSELVARTLAQEDISIAGRSQRLERNREAFFDLNDFNANVASDV